VTRSYVANLRKGRIENPGYEKMLALATAMSFPPEAWFDERIGDRTRPASIEGTSTAGRVQRLFETIGHPKSGEPYTDARVARMSAGVLTEEDVEGIRTGRIADPTVSQVSALAAAFGVPPSYLIDRGTDPSVLDKEALEALTDETAGAILREAARLPEREKRIVLQVVRQFAAPTDA
jgi:transcriptional regulator with XRE-family HTH domain